MLDFSDMLEYPNAPMDVDVVIIDEAQDLSTLQWDFVNKAVIPNAKRVYYAGDDDQAIYQWSGADVQAFQHLPGNREVLHQSHRVPISVHRVAEGIAHGIKNRYAKTYKPKPEAGSVSYHLEPDAVDLSTPGSWLLLARNIHLLPQLVAMVRAQGLPYSYRGESAINSNYVLAIKAWEKRRKGGEPSMEGWEVAKSLLPKGVSMEGKIWHEALVKIPLIDREWLIGILRRGESLTKVPRINIGTIHSVKGGEATNILLLTDMSAKTYNSAQIDHDSEARVWYVAATRAKQNLHIIQPQSRMGYEL
jgi:superfamily I DNA/RNA helicase